MATLAYDCRRTAYFTEQLYAALTLIDRGTLSAGTRGSMHGEIGHTQFLPKNILNYGTGGNLDIAAGCAGLDGKFPQGPWLAARARDISPAKQISQPSRHGMLLRSISGPSRLLANRLTEAARR